MWVKNAIENKPVIGARNFSEVFTWIDAAYDAHNNMRSHTGVSILTGYGIIHGKASKQNINVKISTEADPIGMSEYISYNMWLMMFLKEQVHDIKDHFFKATKVPLSWKRMGETHARATLDILMSDIFREKQDR